MGTDGELFRFGAFELDIAERELRKHGVRIKLQGQPFLVLSRLLANPNQLVTREELRGELWPDDTFVDFEHSLNEAVNKLRTALGDSASKPRFVETVPRHGYRFIAPVDRASKSKPEVPIVDAKEAEPERRSRGPIAFGLAVVVVAALLAGHLASRRESEGGSERVRSLAVLPLDNLSPDPAQEYFGEGMTDELIAQLAKIEELRVISRTSSRRYKGTAKSSRDIGRELGVDALVEGSVRLADDRVRITVQLVEASSDRNLWTETYEGTTADVLDIQSRVARSIAREVRAELDAREEARLAPKNVSAAAYKAYMKGRHHWNQRTENDFLKAIEYFTEATHLEPDYAEAFAGLADTYTLLSVYNMQRPVRAMPNAKAAALEALRLDPDLAEAHAAYGSILFLFDWKWDEAESEFKKAIEVNPGYATTYQYYGIYLVASDRTEEALERLRHALQIDPMSLSVNENLGWALYVARRYPEAIQQFHKTLELDPEFGQALRYLGLTYLYLGRHEDALETLERARRALADEPDVQADLALAHALAGEPEEAERLLDALSRESEERYVSPFLIASFHLGLGHTEQTLDWLDKAYELRVANLVFLGVDPIFDPLRENPRFQSLLRRVGID